MIPLTHGNTLLWYNTINTYGYTLLWYDTINTYVTHFCGMIPLTNMLHTSLV